MLFAIAWFTASMADALKTLKVDIQIYQVPVQDEE